MKKVKKLAAVLVAAMMVLSMAGCGAAQTEKEELDAPQAEADAFDAAKEIGVISREDGSGTRGAFIELFGIEQKNEAGEKVDHTTLDAVITNSTSVMMTTVAGDLYSIGYISMGSLNETIKAVEIDGAAPSVENIKNGSYKVARPFNLATKAELSEAAQDFVDFIMSDDGQKVVEDKGYIAVSENGAYTGQMAEGKIVVSGSTSVTPVMEKLKEAYLAVNPGVTIEIQTSDSSTGVADAIDGTCDIGMASRELKDSELEKGVVPTVIAMDGIAVIVNNQNPVNALTGEQVMKIFTGETTAWSGLVA
ncbi:MAG: extracellular solute-binding protein [Oscillospiraceae bacterium]|nr:extracellular solute-binding protein [Oscillospiraceae bacterium]MBQ9109386.1 extracellular solute-binding protein [Oscillospiraceae bacterium]